jgi:hypothetical protein
MWQHVLSQGNYEAVQEIFKASDGVPEFPDDLWARAVCEFLVVYNKGESDPDRVVEALHPIFYGRQAAFLKETQHLSCDEAEGVVQRQAQAFLDARPYFLDRWDGYVPWVSGGIDSVPQP